jgi:hypothetical protein
MSEKITSPDGKVQITRHSTRYAPIGPISIQGALMNLSNSVVSAKIDVEFFDEAGKLMGPASEIIKDLAPNETRLFDIWGERVPQAYDIDSYKITSLKVI